MRWKIPRRHFHDIFAADEYSLVETWLDTQRYPTLYVFISRLRCHNSATEREREKRASFIQLSLRNFKLDSRGKETRNCNLK